MRLARARRSRVGTVLILTALVASTATRSTSALVESAPAAWAEALAEARELREAGDLRGAIRAYQKTERLAGGEEPVALVELAGVYYDLGLSAKSGKVARDALSKARAPETRAGAADALAVALLAEGRPEPSAVDEALAALRKAVAGEGDVVGLHALHLAELLQRQGESEEALGAARKALAVSLDPKTLDAARIAICEARYALTAASPAPTLQDWDAFHRGESGTINPPRKIHAPQPEYPPQDRKDKIDGVVIVESIIDKEGCVTQTRVLKDIAGSSLGEAARDTVSRWVFSPARLRKDGSTVSVVYNLTINFLHGKPG